MFISIAVCILLIMVKTFFSFCLSLKILPTSNKYAFYWEHFVKAVVQLSFISSLASFVFD